MSQTIKDSGKRDTFQTGAVRDGQTGKGRFDLLPYHAIERVAKVFELGAAKYEARNWEKGIPTHRFMDSGLRHAMKFLAGHEDEDHLAMAAWNLLCLLETKHFIQEGVLPADLDTLPGRRERPFAIEHAADRAEGLKEHGRTSER